MSEERRAAALAELPEAGAASLRRLEKQLEAVRAQGFEMQPSARVAGVTDISFPVFGFDGHVSAALTLPFLVTIDGSQRTDREETRVMLGDAARQISEGLGWLRPAFD
jgi:DNA-binding IclR family transcriptional regulator